MRQLNLGGRVDFKIFSSVLAALLAFALIISVVRAIEQRHEEQAIAHYLSTGGASGIPAKSMDDVLRKAREDRARTEPSIVDGLRAAREQKESPSH